MFVFVHVAVRCLCILILFCLRLVLLFSCLGLLSYLFVSFLVFSVLSLLRILGGQLESRVFIRAHGAGARAADAVLVCVVEAHPLHPWHLHRAGQLD